MAARSEGRGGLPGVTWLEGGALGWDPGTLGLITVSGALGAVEPAPSLLPGGAGPASLFPALSEPSSQGARRFSAL